MGVMTLFDMHCHGAAGAEFGSDPVGNRRALSYHRERGVAEVVASLVSAPVEVLEAQVSVLAGMVAAGEIAGIHLEGPCLSPEFRGAHLESALCMPSARLVESLVAAAAEGGAEGAIVQWTFAPELPGAEDFVRALAAYRILPAIGHTGADAATTERALGLVNELTEGEALVTHLFNGMPPMHHRGGGPVSAALAAAGRGEATLELITDGVHVHPEVVRMVFDLVGAEQIALVSDATPATGLGDGDYQLGGLSVRVSDGTARLLLAGGDWGSVTGSIAGSTSTLASCVEWASAVAGVSEADALLSASVTPRRVLGLA